MVKEIYILTEDFPVSERFGLTSQIRRAAVSIPSNIAEGTYRNSRKEYAHFLHHSFASGAELETQITIAKMLNITKNFNYIKIDELLMR